MKHVRVAISGVGSLIGQAVVKSLRHPSAGFPVEILGLDYFQDSIGFRYSDHKCVLPDMLSADFDEKEWVEALTSTLRQHKINYLFIGVDFELQIFSRLRSEIEARSGATIFVPPESVVSRCRDKLVTALWLEEVGFRAPVSIDAQSSSFDDLAKSLGCPFIVKPRFGSRSRGVSIVNDQREFLLSTDSIQLPMAQEFLPDDGAEFTCGVAVHEGHTDTVCVLRRTLRDGNTWDAVSAISPEIETYAGAIARALIGEGLINVQLRLRDGIPIAFEINPRCSGTTYFRTLLGVNQPARLICFKEGINFEQRGQMRLARVRRIFDEVVEEIP